MIHREKSQKHPERMSGELANNQSTTGVSMLRAFLTSGIFACFALPQTSTTLVSGRVFVCNILIYIIYFIRFIINTLFLFIFSLIYFIF
jgi:hypothetical protein